MATVDYMCKNEKVYSCFKCTSLHSGRVFAIMVGCTGLGTVVGTVDKLGDDGFKLGNSYAMVRPICDEFKNAYKI